MSKTKKRHITFHEVYEVYHLPVGKITCKTLPAVIDYIKSRTKVNRRFSVNSEKICLLESASYNGKEEYFELYFKSARHGTRKPLINRNTTSERENPKTLDEGEIEKTHLILKVNKSETFGYLEKNKDGLTMINIMEYLNHFQRKMNAEKSTGKDYHFKEEKIIREDFIEALSKLKRVKLATLFYDKSFLGSEHLDLSNRTIDLKKEIEINLISSRGNSIKELAVDVFNKLGTRNKKAFKRMRIEGINESDGNVVLNTEYFEKKETLNIEYDNTTGQINTTDAFRKMRLLMNS